MADFEEALNRAKAEWNRVQQNPVKLLPQVIPPEVVRNSPKNGCVWNWVALLPSGLKMRFDDNPKRTANQNKRIVSPDGSFVNAFRKIKQLPGYEDQVYQCVSKPWAQATGLLRNKAQIQEIGDQKKETSVWWVEDDEQFRKALQRTGNGKALQRIIRRETRKQPRNEIPVGRFRRKLVRPKSPQAKKRTPEPEKVVEQPEAAKPKRRMAPNMFATTEELEKAVAAKEPEPKPVEPEPAKPKRRMAPNMFKDTAELEAAVASKPVEPKPVEPKPVEPEKPKRRMAPNMFKDTAELEAAVAAKQAEPEQPKAKTPTSPKPVPSAVLQVSKKQSSKPKSRDIEHYQWLEQQVKFWTKQVEKAPEPKFQELLKSYQERLQAHKAKFEFPEKLKPLSKSRIKEKRAKANEYAKEIGKLKKRKVLTKQELEKLKQVNKKLDRLESQWPGILGKRSADFPKPKEGSSPKAVLRPTPKVASPKQPTPKASPKGVEEKPPPPPPAVKPLGKKQLKKLSKKELKARAAAALEVFDYVTEWDLTSLTDWLADWVAEPKPVTPGLVRKAQKFIDAAETVLAGQRRFNDEFCRVIGEVDDFLKDIKNTDLPGKLEVKRFVKASKRWAKKCSAEQSPDEDLDIEKPLALIDLVEYYSDFADFLSKIWILKEMEKYKDQPVEVRIEKYSAVKKTAAIKADEALFKLWQSAGLEPELVYVSELLGILAEAELADNPKAKANLQLAKYLDALDKSAKSGFNLIWDKKLYDERKKALAKLEEDPLSALKAFEQVAMKRSEDIAENSDRYAEKFTDQEKAQAKGDVEKWHEENQQAYARLQRTLGLPGDLKK